MRKELKTSLIRMNDTVFQIRSKDDEVINKFCVALNKTIPCPPCIDVMLPDLPNLTEFRSFELTTEGPTTFITTDLTTSTTEETDKVWSTSDPMVDAMSTDSISPGDKPPSTTTSVDESSLTDTVTSTQQSTTSVDLLSTTTIRKEFTPTTQYPKNSNAALFLGLALVGVLFLIVVVVILFYKFYYKPKKSRSLTVTPTSGHSPQEVNKPPYYHDPVKSYVELHPANPIPVQTAWDEKSETKEPNVKKDDIDGKSSPSALPPIVSTTQGGVSDTSKPKNEKKKKKKRKVSKADGRPTIESHDIGNGTGGPKEVVT